MNKDFGDLEIAAMRWQRIGHGDLVARVTLVVLATTASCLPTGCNAIADSSQPPASLASPSLQQAAQATAKRAVQSTTKPVAQVPISPKKSRAQLVDANTRFGFKLFQQLQQQQPDANVFVSPSSVAIALSMTYNGANGATQKAINEALQLNGMSVANLNKANELLKASLEGSDPKVKLKIANSLWAKRGINFNPEFLKQNQNFYKANVSALDFSSSDALGQINNWVGLNTEGKISKILDRINPDDAMYLINAVYFKGDWTVPFKKSATKDEPFTLANGEKKNLPTMRRNDSFNYSENEQFQAVNLPYGNGRWSMYLFLPRGKTNLSDFSTTLTVQNWQTWMRGFRFRSGYVQLPKFKTEFSTDLKASLTALGMGQAFDPYSADFSNLTKDMQLFISQVKHKTFVEVNESGTEAAAATSVIMVPTSAQMPEQPFRMIVDRPFFCAIRDNETGTVLFMGHIQNPET
jgi:serine protease inhibitor